MHAIDQKLKNQILPYFAAADLMKRHPPYVATNLYRMCNELLVMLGSIGFSHPFITYANNSNAQKATNDLLNELSGSPYFYASFVLAIGWVVWRVIINHNHLLKRQMGAEEYCQKARQLENRMWKALGEEAQMPGLIEVQKQIQDLVDRHSEPNGAYLFNGIPTSKEADALVNERFNAIKQRFAEWPDAPELRKRTNK